MRNAARSDAGYEIRDDGIFARFVLVLVLRPRPRNILLLRSEDDDEDDKSKHRVFMSQALALNAPAGIPV